MNTRILLAFLGGAALASGIVYMAVKPDAKPVTKTVYVASQEKPATAAPGTEPAAAPAPASVLKSPVVSEETPSRPGPSARKTEIRRGKVNYERRHQPAPTQVARVVTPAPAPAVVATPAVTTPPPDPEPRPTTAAAAPAPAPSAPEPPKIEPRQPHTVTLAAGTPLNVRLGETLSTQRNKPGDTFTATLDQPLVVDGFVIAERGARCEGRVMESDAGGRVRGVAHLELELTSIHTADGQRVRVHTSGFGKDAETSRKTDAAKVGGGAALGAIIGAIAGGGKGAAVGAGVGGAAGAGDVALTRGKAAELRVETRVSFRVQEPVTITERLD